MFDRILDLFVDVRREERRALLWSFSYFFLILSAYYILRPLRDNAGITGGTRSLPWLFTATFFVMLAAAPLYGWVVARVPRRRLIPLLYHFFAAKLDNLNAGRGRMPDAVLRRRIEQWFDTI